MIKQNTIAPVLCLVFFSLLLGSGLAFAEKAFDRIVVFGDSLSDPGNAFFLTGVTIKPPYSSLDEFLIPGAPYERGGHHFSNGETWVERFAAKLDLKDSVGPAFRGENRGKLKETNYAVGGARARDYGQNVNLTTQLEAFLSDVEGQASEQSLYVVALGGNDLRDAVAALARDNSGLASAEIIATALSAISDAVIALYSAGAKTVMVANVPDLSLTPAIRKLDHISPGAVMGASILSAQFNYELDGLLDTLGQSTPDLEIISMDLYKTTREIIADPETYGFLNVHDSCVMPNQEPAACKKPNTYFFWDGIHPSKKTHRVFARKAHEVYINFKNESEVVCLPSRKPLEAGCKSSFWL
ncbi:MAG: SGNH/GDSL hydrolase family protein [Candidatus Thiodiazotropha sp. DIVDIV]